MRADAERNRVKVLEAAMAAFESDGLSVSVAEIGRRAGVGTGTVSRHFPTKESLYEAIVLARVTEIVGHARDLLATRDPAAAFFEFFAYMVGQAAANRGLAEALSGGGYDIEAAASRTEHGLEDVENELLARAQRAGAVRADVTNADVKALVVACLVRERRPPDEAARRRMIDIASTGLRPTTT
jgi:AcrR family transcriptional regulator